jgi:hypothetical protein
VETEVRAPTESKEMLIGEVENLWIGKAQSGINISTCRDRTLEESPTDFGDDSGKQEGLERSLETNVDVRKELRPMDVQELVGATTGS